MADKSINELNAASVVQAADLFVLEQNGQAKKLTGQILENWLVSFADGHGGIQSVTKISSSGTNPVVDTYRMVFADTTHFDYTVTNGVKGDTGQAWYVHIKYATKNPTADSDMGNTPDGNSWIGIYSGTSSTAPAHYTSYAWGRFKGDQGVQGISVSALSEVTVTHTPGTYDTYRFSLVDGSTPAGYTQTFSVYNGQDGEGSPGTATPLADSSSGDVGVANAYAREDHVHPFQVSSSNPAALGVATPGIATTYARSDHVHPAPSNTFTVTLATADWSSNAQTVSNANFVTSGYAYFVDPASASRDEYIDSGIYAADSVTTNGQMVFYCESVPSSALTVKVIRMVSA